MAEGRDVMSEGQQPPGGGHAPMPEGEEQAPPGVGTMAVVRWALRRAMPVKFKAAEFNAKGSEVGIEELHLAHEGLRLERPGKGA